MQFKNAKERVLAIKCEHGYLHEPCRKAMADRQNGDLRNEANTQRLNLQWRGQRILVWTGKHWSL